MKRFTLKITLHYLLYLPMSFKETKTLYGRMRPASFAGEAEGRGHEGEDPWGDEGAEEGEGHLEAEPRGPMKVK